MEKQIQALKEYIISSTRFFTSLSDDDTPMTGLTEPDVIIGPVDVSRYEQNVICSLLPSEEQETEEGTLNAEESASHIIVTFICQGVEQEILARQAFRFAQGLWNALFFDDTLGGKVNGFNIGQRRFFLDSGPVKGFLSAVEIDLTLFNETLI